MKKLLVILALVAATGAHAANVVNGSPLYKPGENHFYSETNLATRSNNVNAYTLSESMYYGITDRVTVGASIVASEKDGFKEAQWNVVAANVSYRFVNDMNWKVDAIASYGLNNLWSRVAPKSHSLLDKENTTYTWMGGARIGYETSQGAVALHANYAYTNTESFNWGNEGFGANHLNHVLNIGVDGQYILNNCWNLVAGADYFGYMGRGAWEQNKGHWELKAGVNYNIDATKYVGVYINKTIAHADDTPEHSGNWKGTDGIGMGIKFGIDF